MAFVSGCARVSAVLFPAFEKASDTIGITSPVDVGLILPGRPEDAFTAATDARWKAYTDNAGKNRQAMGFVQARSEGGCLL